MTQLLEVLRTLLGLLLLTLLLECAAALILLRSRRALTCCVLCNLLTNPALNVILISAASVSWYVFGAVHPGAYMALTLVLELGVVYVEAGLYTRLCGFAMKRSLLLSLLLNGISFGVGLLLQRA